MLQHMHHFPQGSLSQGTPPDVSQLASSHENVTILFTEWVCARCATALCACHALKAEQNPKEGPSPCPCSMCRLGCALPRV